MKGERIPSGHNVGLHCTPKLFTSIDENGQPSGINSDKFKVDADGISVNWLEFHNNNPDKMFADMCSLLKGRDVKKSHRVGMIAIVDIEKIQTINGDNLFAEHDPQDGPPPNPGHSLIKGLTPDDAQARHDLSTVVEIRVFA